MQIRLLSDLHLEFNTKRYLDIPSGDVLILAGDICLADEIEETIPFFQQCVEKYNKVFYVLGNHEHYYSKYKDVHSRIKHALPEGITLLQNQSEYYNGVHFVGSTLWTDFHGSGLEMEKAKQYMNDYHVIDGFTPELAVKENDNSIEWFKQCVSMLKKGPVVMITHHPPSTQSVHGRYLDSLPAYSNRLDKFITDHPNISHWVSGHCHHNNDYMIGNCRMLSNPRGYEPTDLNPDFDVNFEIEV